VGGRAILLPGVFQSTDLEQSFLINTMQPFFEQFLKVKQCNKNTCSCSEEIVEEAWSTNGLCATLVVVITPQAETARSNLSCFEAASTDRESPA